MHDLVEVAHQLDGLLGRLAEAGARIDADAGARRRRPPPRQRPHRAGSRALRPPRPRTTGSSCMVAGSPFMCMTTQPAAAAAHRFHHGGIAEARHVVDDGSAGMQGATRHLGMARVHRTRRCRASTQGRHDIADAIPLLFRRDRRGARARGLAAHIHDGGTRRAPCPARAPRPPSGSRYAPPSEKESGVTFKMPMMMGVLVSKSYCPQCQIMNAEASSFSAFPPLDSQPISVTAQKARVHWFSDECTVISLRAGFKFRRMHEKERPKASSQLRAGRRPWSPFVASAASAVGGRPWSPLATGMVAVAESG